MAWESPIQQLPGQLAGSDFRTGNGYQGTGQFLFTKLSADDTHVPCSAVGDLPIGVSQTNPNTGGALAVMSDGVSKIVAGGTIAAGDELGTDAQGKAIVKGATSTGAAYGQFIRAIALEAASAGELVTAKLIGPYKVH